MAQVWHTFLLRGLVLPILPCKVNFTLPIEVLRGSECPWQPWQSALRAALMGGKSKSCDKSKSCEGLVSLNKDIRL